MNDKTQVVNTDVQPLSAPVAIEPPTEVAAVESTVTTLVEESQPESKLILEPDPQRYCRTSNLWLAMDEAVVGLSHRAKNLPCQDAAQAVNLPRPIVVVADGAGSSVVSEIGARAVVSGTIRLLDTLERQLIELLDNNVPNFEASAKTLGLMLVKHAVGLLKDLAMQHRREIRDFRCTFLVMVVGKTRLLWVKVGDGALVIEKMQVPVISKETLTQPHAELSTLGELGKGEFANQTQFLDAVTPADVQIGLLASNEISGIAVMSDGASERLVSNDGCRVAPRVSTLLQQLRENKLHRQTLTQMFYEEAFCKGTTGDDRSIALAACEVIAPEPTMPSKLVQDYKFSMSSKPQENLTQVQNNTIQSTPEQKITEPIESNLQVPKQTINSPYHKKYDKSSLKKRNK